MSIDVTPAGHVLEAGPRRFNPRALLTIAACLFVAGLVAWLVWPSSDGGDPGGQVMNQLTPAASSFPGYGTSALPWVGQIPQSLTAPYIIAMEPQQDSCDGRAGTQGWGQVVVQSKFRWEGELSSLISHMEPRLRALGWILEPPPAAPPADWTPGVEWTKKLNTGTLATLLVSVEEPGFWEAVAEGDPIGQAASGC